MHEVRRVVGVEHALVVGVVGGERLNRCVVRERNGLRPAFGQKERAQHIAHLALHPGSETIEAYPVNATDRRRLYDSDADQEAEPLEGFGDAVLVPATI